MSYSILAPFGPKIYRSKVNESIFDLLLQLSEEKRNMFTDATLKTTGYTNGAFLTIENYRHYNDFYDEIKIHILNYIQGLNNKLDIPTVQMELSNRAWVNFQRPDDFNSMHTHQESAISIVVYLKVPEEISIENTKWNAPNQPKLGMIEFAYGSQGTFCDSTYAILPQVGDIILFPSNIMHQVYPFKSNVERWSINFNISSLHFSEIAEQEE